jgi:molybdate transport system substrate-binding protein
MGRPVFVRLAIAGLTLAIVAVAAPSIAADIQVFTSGAPSAVQKKLAPAFTKATGHNVVITAETINLILKRLEGASGLEGDAGPDVVVIPRPALAKFNKSGALRPGTMVDIARVGIGVVVKEGSPRPDISTTDALRKTLLNAKSIAHPNPKGGGFTGAHIDRMLERLGIADAVRPKVRLGFAFAGGVDSVAKGEVELGIFNISEIVPAKGVTLVGPLPDEHQNYLVFAGALHVRGASPGPAAAYLRALIEPGAEAAWTAGGMEALGDPALTGTVPGPAGKQDRPAK